ncbi:MAG: hypothetical protein ACREQW_14260 [Candidatus Binatia bacterium]
MLEDAGFAAALARARNTRVAKYCAEAPPRLFRRCHPIIRVGSAAVAAVRGINTRVVMCFVDRPLLDLVATPDIRSIADLKGKLLGLFLRAMT